MLFMASGKLVKDYRLLARYFEVLDEMGVDRAVSTPSSGDIEFVIRATTSGRISLLDALSMLIRRYIPRVNPVAAKRAVKEVLGEDVDEQTAVDMIARDLAGWTLEIAENMNLIRFDTSILR